MPTILIVDDNEDMCQIISDVMKAEGYMVEVAYDGRSAMNEIQTMAYDLMILDYRLFDCDGLEILEQAKRAAPLLNTIMISAYGNEPVKERARVLGACAFFDKPFAVNDLLKVVRKALGKNQGAE